MFALQMTSIPQPCRDSAILLVDPDPECLTCAFSLAPKFLEMIFFHMFCRDFWACASCMLTYWLEKALSSWLSHLESLTWEKITIAVIFASKFVLLDSWPACVKNLKTIFVSDSRKAWSDDFTVCCFQYREPDFVQFTVLDFGNWQLTDWQINRIRVLLYFLISLLPILKSRRYKAVSEIEPNNRDLRKWYIELRNLFGFLLSISYS